LELSYIGLHGKKMKLGNTVQSTQAAQAARFKLNLTIAIVVVVIVVAVIVIVKNLAWPP